MSTELNLIEGARLLLKGARLLDPATGLDAVEDLLIEDGLIAARGPGLEAEDAEVLELEGLLVVPGFVDLRARFGEPGHEDRETIESGLDAAAAGGYTAVCLTPENEPAGDTAGAIEFLLARAEEHPVTLLPLGAVTQGLKGERLADLGELARAGVAGYCEGNRGLRGAAALRGALSYSRMFGLPLFELARDASFEGGHVHEGLASLRMGLKGTPRLAEDLGVQLGIRVAEYEEARLHLQLISTRESIALLRAAKARGALVTADCSPQHLALSDGRCLDYDPAARLLPPLRPEEDRLALVAAAAAGVLDAVCSDHRPAEFDDLDKEYPFAPFGCASLETAFAVAHRALVESGACDLERLLELFSAGPRRILGLPPAGFEAGTPAELTLLDLACSWTYRGAEALTLGVNSPWEGVAFTVRPAGMVNGRYAALRG
ncbi:MAG: dihydroorotase [bacterium]|nr:dihydroorotase [bacterium]